MTPGEPLLLDRIRAGARRFLYRCAVKVMQWYFVGKEAYRLSSIDGQTLVRDKGKIIGCGHQPGGFVLRYMAYGNPAIRLVAVERMKLDKSLGSFAFYD